MRDQGVYFFNDTIQNHTDHFLMKDTLSSIYSPQENRLVESINKTLFKILQKLVEDNRATWNEHLPIALFCLSNRIQGGIRTLIISVGI